MNAKSLPIQVAEEWQKIAEFIRQQISASGLPFEVKTSKSLGVKIIYKKYKKIFFDIADYHIDEIDNMAYYSIVQVPENRLTSIEDSLEEVRHRHDHGVKVSFSDWLNLVKDFERLDSVDLMNLFQMEDDEFFLQNEPDTFSEKDKVLPYCLKSLLVSNFQGIKRATIENLPIDINWVFLVGENGFGKSTILQAIALGLHGTKDGSYEYIQDSAPRIKVEYKNNGDSPINDYKSNLTPLLHFASYGPVRLNMQIDASISEAAQKSGTLYSLFRTDGVLLNIESELVKWALKKDSRFKLIKNAFCKLVPNISDVRFNSSNDTIEYVEKDMSDQDVQYDPLPFEKIASGFRSILGMAGDMIIRLSNSQKDVKDPSKLKGIVVIDELDLHWHPKLQKQIPELFSKVFPNIQFIASTHSPIPLLGAPRNSIVLKVNRTREAGITVERVEIDLKTLTPNLLLTSGIFDMDDIFSSQADSLTDVRTEDTFEELEKNNEVSKYLEDFEKSNAQFPDELFESTKR